MKKLFLIVLLFAKCNIFSQTQSGEMSLDFIYEICNSVSDWQISNHDRVKHHPLDWTNGALYRGMVEWAKVSGNEKCYKFVYDIGVEHNWNMWNRTYHADDICVGQAFIELYRKYGDKRMLQPVLERAYYVANHPSDAPLLKTNPIGSNERWSWCDALFMAPPVYAALYSITGESVYLDYLDKEFKECVDSLYDKKFKLFYRDNARIKLKEKNGAKQFWGRGNGWVFAGLPLIIDNLPLNCASRDYYISLFVEMAEAVLETQCEGGEWRSSLLDPDSYKMPENSCSAFMCYGLTWGIRNGYLPYRQYGGAVKKAWKSLVNAVHEDGKVGYIQPVGASPKSAGPDSTDVYGVGAFLLAGSELYRWLY